MLKIVKDNAKSLHSPSKSVQIPLIDEDRKTLEEMLQYLKNSQDPEFLKKNPKVREGIGLAAPQIGINKRMLVIYYCRDEEKNEYVTYQLANPKIISSSIKECYLERGEGCLSVDDDHPGYAYRHYKITVRAYELSADKEIDIRAVGFDAIVLQHEIDHLDGLLFYDRIDKDNPFKKKLGSVAI